MMGSWKRCLSGWRGRCVVRFRNLPQARPAVVDHVRREPEEGERKTPKPRAVGMSEAAKMLGISPRTLWSYVSERRIRAVRFGRRVLVPMEVLERVAVEGVAKGRGRTAIRLVNLHPCQVGPFSQDWRTRL